MLRDYESWHKEVRFNLNEPGDPGPNGKTELDNFKKLIDLSRYNNDLIDSEIKERKNGDDNLQIQITENKTEFDSHNNDVKHITADERKKWNEKWNENEGKYYVENQISGIIGGANYEGYFTHFCYGAIALNFLELISPNGYETVFIHSSVEETFRPFIVKSVWNQSSQKFVWDFPNRVYVSVSNGQFGFASHTYNADEFDDITVDMGPCEFIWNGSINSATDQPNNVFDVILDKEGVPTMSKGSVGTVNASDGAGGWISSKVLLDAPVGSSFDRNKYRMFIDDDDVFPDNSVQKGQLYGLFVKGKDAATDANSGIMKVGGQGGTAIVGYSGYVDDFSVSANATSDYYKRILSGFYKHTGNVSSPLDLVLKVGVDGKLSAPLYSIESVTDDQDLTPKKYVDKEIAKAINAGGGGGATQYELSISGKLDGNSAKSLHNTEIISGLRADTPISWQWNTEAYDSFDNDRFAIVNIKVIDGWIYAYIHNRGSQITWKDGSKLLVNVFR
jgi:hypothetical protein